MPKRSYEQTCPIARSLDVVGERWTLLLVRELMLGPKRFKDLLRVLPTLGPNRLAERLKDLQAAGVVAKRVLPAPATVPVYELTPYGERLRPALASLAAWGAALPMDDGLDLMSTRAEVLAFVLASNAPLALTRGIRDIYDLRVGDERFCLHVNDGDVDVRTGPAAAPPGAAVECDLATFMALAARKLTPSEALRDKRVRLKGQAPTLARIFKILSSRNLETNERMGIDRVA